jgi:hypothetical protein
MNLSLSDFVAAHLVLSLIGLSAGGGVMLGMLGGRTPPRLTALFLLSTLLADVAGLLFPLVGGRHSFDPAPITSLMSLLALVPTISARFRFKLAGPWSRIYVAGATLLLWLNASIAIRQAFVAIAYLRPLSDSAVPHVAQFAVSAALVLLGLLAAEQMDDRTGGRHQPRL